MLGYCEDCARYFWYPRPICPLCRAFGAGLRESAGRGEIYSFTWVRNGIDEDRDVPACVLAYVRLDEGPCLLTHIVAVTGPIAIGDRVEVVFHKTGGAATLPRFRPAD
jgi:hypothetical protein